MKLKNITFIAIITALFFSCSNDEFYLPKPASYFRIDLAEKVYEPAELTLPLTFQKPLLSLLEQRPDKNQFNLSYPQFKAKVHFTYFDLEDKDIQPFLEDAYNYAYQHNIKATAINTQSKSSPENSVYGLVYNLKGDVASQVQFYATDSVNHFLRGALYFSHAPNSDSVAPVLDYIKSDVDHLFQTLKWK